jgi:hypothetical protein
MKTLLKLFLFIIPIPILIKLIQVIYYDVFFPVRFAWLVIPLIFLIIAIIFAIVILCYKILETLDEAIKIQLHK